tara:strand:- start:4086 stop:4619 length:534 start_codon:yes stop_codon:yes gene_type:complete
MSDSPSFWATYWANFKSGASKAFRWVVRYPIALIISIVVLGVGFVLVYVGVDLNLGRVVDTLFGRKLSPRTRIKLSGTLDPNRVSDAGAPIDMGEMGPEGFVQNPVSEVKVSLSPLRDKTIIEVENDEGTVQEIKLPRGVTDDQVHRVYESRMEVTSSDVTVNSAVTAAELLNRLGK